MALDHSIYFQQQPIDFVGSFERGLKMSDMMRQRKIEEKKLADQQAITDAYNSSQVEGGGFDDKRFMSQLAGRNVDGMTQMAFKEKFSDQQLKQVDEAKKKLSLAGSILGSAQDQVTYESAINLAVRHGLVKPGEMPAQFDPNYVAGLLRANMTAQEQLKMLAERDAKDIDAFGRGVIVKRGADGRVSGMERDPNYQQPTKPLHPLEEQKIKAELLNMGLRPLVDRNQTIRDYNARGLQPEFNEAGQIIGVKLLPEEAARRALEEKKTNAEIAEKEARTKNLKKKGGPPSQSAIFKSLPIENQEQIKKLSAGTANQKMIMNQLSGDLTVLNSPSVSDEQKLVHARSMIKTLNSKNGADAVGSEEAKRLAGLLEFRIVPRIGEPGPLFGRADMSEFVTQVNNMHSSLQQSVKQNEAEIQRLYGRGQPGQASMPPAPPAVRGMTREQKIQLLQKLDGVK